MQPAETERNGPRRLSSRLSGKPYGITRLGYIISQFLLKNQSNLIYIFLTFRDLKPVY